MMFYFLNEDKTYRPCELDEWSNQFENMSIQGVRHVAEDFINGCHVSTIWLGMNHNYFGGVPLLLETMVFDTPHSGHDIYMKRYTTWEQAVEGHKKAVQWVLDGCHDDE